MALSGHQARIDRWFKRKKWAYWTPHQSLARLIEEVGELARLINHRFGPKKKKNSEAEQDLEDEIGDILYALACIANSLRINLDDALERSIRKVETRDRSRFS